MPMRSVPRTGEWKCVVTRVVQAIDINLRARFPLDWEDTAGGSRKLLLQSISFFLRSIRSHCSGLSKVQAIRRSIASLVTRSADASRRVSR